MRILFGPECGPLTEMESKLETVRDAVVERLQAYEQLAGIEILSRKTGDLLNKIEQSLLTLGVGILVAIPEATPKRIQKAQVHIDPAHLTVTVLENPLLNQTETHALGLAEFVASALVMWNPIEGDNCGPLQFRDPGIVQVNTMGDLDRDDLRDLYTVDVCFQFRCTLDTVGDPEP